MDIMDLKKATRLRHILMVFACLLLFYGLIPVYGLGLDRRDFIIASILFFCGSLSFWGGSVSYDYHTKWRLEYHLNGAILAWIIWLIFLCAFFYQVLISV